MATSPTPSTDHLEQVLYALSQDNAKAAEQAMHNYVVQKTDHLLATKLNLGQPGQFPK